MSQQTTRRCDYRVVGDADGSRACGREAQNISFYAEATVYTADLCQRHADMLTNRIAPFVAVGSPVKVSYSDTPKIRAWLREQGHELSDRGRIPIPLLIEYHEANSS